MNLNRIKFAVNHLLFGGKYNSKIIFTKTGNNLDDIRVLSRHGILFDNSFIDEEDKNLDLTSEMNSVSDCIFNFVVKVVNRLNALEVCKEENETCINIMLKCPYSQFIFASFELYKEDNRVTTKVKNNNNVWCVDSEKLIKISTVSNLEELISLIPARQDLIFELAKATEEFNKAKGFRIPPYLLKASIYRCIKHGGLYEILYMNDYVQDHAVALNKAKTPITLSDDILYPFHSPMVNPDLVSINKFNFAGTVADSISELIRNDDYTIVKAKISYSNDNKIGKCYLFDTNDMLLFKLISDLALRDSVRILFMAETI